MTDSAIIALCAACFACVTWLLGISFFIGKYASRVESVETTVKGMDAKFGKIFDKLDTLNLSVQHHCIQSDRITRLEAASDRREPAA